MDDRHQHADRDDHADRAEDRSHPAQPGSPEGRREPTVVRIGHETADCRRYAPGHTVHFIQARHAAEYPDPVPVLASVDDTGQILIVDGTGGLRLHNHSPARVAAALARSGGRAELVLAKSALGVPSTRAGALFSIATDHRWSPCAPGPRPRGTAGRNGPDDSGRGAE